jgi:DNA-binding response OmpR family regulator
LDQATLSEFERSDNVIEGQVCVLLADDDPDYLWLLQTHLQIRGYKVLIARDGIGALDKAATKEPDLLILDVQMPGIDGCTVCQRIREFSSVPVILLSGLSTPAAVVRGLDAGADHYMTKPVSIEELLSRMGALLQRTERRPQPAIAPQRKRAELAF